MNVKSCQFWNKWNWKREQALQFLTPELGGNLVQIVGDLQKGDHRCRMYWFAEYFWIYMLFNISLVFLKLVRTVVLHFDPCVIHWIPHTTTYLIEKNLLVMSSVSGSRTFLASMSIWSFWDKYSLCSRVCSYTSKLHTQSQKWVWYPFWSIYSSPHMLHVVSRAKPLKGRPWWEKQIMEECRCDYSIALKMY